jgi:tetratricopeptide (TPR) repeat protein
MNWKLPVFERWERRKRKQWYEKLVKESPSQEALGQLAAICAVEGNHTRAVELFGEAIDRDGDDQDSRYGRALSYMELQQLPAAIDDLHAAIAVEPYYKMHQGQIALARCYAAVDRKQDAAKVYRDILARNPVSAANYGLGKILAEQGDTQQARELMEEVLSKQTGLPRYLRRQERPWVARAKKLLRTLPKA